VPRHLRAEYFDGKPSLVESLGTDSESMAVKKKPTVVARMIELIDAAERQHRLGDKTKPIDRCLDAAAKMGRDMADDSTYAEIADVVEPVMDKTLTRVIGLAAPDVCSMVGTRH
jgi:hypothetical protein